MKIFSAEKKQFYTLILFLTLALLFASTAAQAGDIKQQMAARLPAITNLKNSGIVGENNQGLLKFRGPKTEEKLVAAENNDRISVYAAIAKSQKVSAALVGQRRAAQIAEKGSSGQKFQRPDGSWYTK
ncbi:MAG: YdbL family protein [Desulforhopalus sp.]|nr:YdbL family protein [Desulforhopalus sp.]